MNEVTQAIAEFISGETGLAFPEAHKLIEVPRDSQWGDYAFPCFTLARIKRKAPQFLAREIAAKFQPQALLTECVPEGAYLNFRIRRQAWAEIVLKKIFSQGQHYGESSAGVGQRVLIEFSSPNIAKPFHVGHLRSTILGHALGQIFARLGYEVVRLNHLGDWGKQFGEVICAFKRWGDPARLQAEPLKHLLEVYSRFHVESKENEALNEEARAWFKKLEDGEE